MYKIRNNAICNSSVTLFLVGFKTNSFWRIHKWILVYLSLRRILRELATSKDIGYLGGESWFGNPNIIVQYWRSYDDLLKYARNTNAKHFPVWVRFNEYFAVNGELGLWHEIYVVEKEKMEGQYRNMAPIGLGRACGFTAMKGSRIKPVKEA